MAQVPMERLFSSQTGLSADDGPAHILQRSWSVTWVQLTEAAVASALIAVHRDIFVPSFSESCPYLNQVTVPKLQNEYLL